MDTRFWGPSGWQLLHSITNKYPNNPDKLEKDAYEIFFKSLPFILPCIYCRNSLTEYYKQYPINGIETDESVNSPLYNNHNLRLWLYNIHNLVNDKLRGQGLLTTENPEFKEVIDNYTESSCEKCWDFIYAIALNYPDNKQLITNRQYLNYKLFLNYLPKVLPDSLLATKVNNFMIRHPLQYFIEMRDPLSKWIYALEKKCNNCDCCYSKRCNQIEQYRAGCKGNDKEDKLPTCRKK